MKAKVIKSEIFSLIEVSQAQFFEQAVHSKQKSGHHDRKSGRDMQDDLDLIASYSRMPVNIDFSCSYLTKCLLNFRIISDYFKTE